MAIFPFEKISPRSTITMGLAGRIRSKCGKQIDDNAKKCDICGAELSRPDIIATVNEKLSIVNTFIDKGLDFLRDLPLIKIVDTAEGILGKLGIFSFYLLGVIGLTTGIVAAFRYETIENVWVGLGWLFACILFGYIGPSLLNALQKMVASAKNSFSSNAILNCLAILFLLSGIAALASGIDEAIKYESIDEFWYGLIAFAALELTAVATLKSQWVSTETGVCCTPGEEFIGLITFFLKVVMRIVPFVWCIYTFFIMINLIIHLGADDLGQLFSESFTQTIFLGLLPLKAYLVFLLYHFVIDLAKSVLSLPAKLDKLNK